MSGSTDRTLRVWDLDMGACLAVVSNDSDVIKTVVFSGGVAFGTEAGQVAVRHPIPSLLLTAPLVTASRFWQFGDAPNPSRKQRLAGWLRQLVGEPSGHCDKQLTGACTWCGHRFPVDRPDPASEGSDIHCPAPDCGQPLRLTPFVCDPRDSGWG